MLSFKFFVLYLFTQVLISLAVRQYLFNSVSLFILIFFINFGLYSKVWKERQFTVRYLVKPLIALTANWVVWTRWELNQLRLKYKASALLIAVCRSRSQKLVLVSQKASFSDYRNTNNSSVFGIWGLNPELRIAR